MKKSIPYRKFVLVSADFSGIGFAIQEIQQNDSEVIIAYKPKEAIDEKKLESYEIQGNGIVETIPLDDIMEERKKYKEYFWVWDGNHNVKENELLRKEGFKVIHGGEFCYNLENDREYGIEYAKEAGLESPPYHEFDSAEDGVSFLEENEDKAYVVKPNNAEDSALTQPFSRTLEPKNANLEARKYLKALDVSDYILQERKKGVEVNIELFFSHGVPVFAQANLEDKYRHNGDLGCPTGCSFDVCWKIDLDSELVKRTAGKMLDDLQKRKYTGFADVNVIIGDDEVWFLEYCARIGYNAHPNLFQTLSKKTFLQSMADLYEGTIPDMKQGFGASITMFTDRPFMSIPIYVPKSVMPNVHFFDVFKSDEDEEDEYSMGGLSNEIAIVTGFGYTIQTAFESALDNVCKIKFVNADYRTDCCNTDYPLSIVRRYEALKAMNLL
jgi:phosphoribosylamine-glycine ligase